MSSQKAVVYGMMMVALCAMTTEGRGQEAPPGQGAAPGESPPSGGNDTLAEVVVTGAKTVEHVQVAPMAVTEITPETLETTHAGDLSDIASLVPNLQIHEITGNTADAAGIYLRGFGTSQVTPSSDPAIPIYIDGVYQPQVSGSLFDLFSESLQVLRGPQGTNFGKNATAGAILVTTTRPSTDQFSGKVQVDYGSFDKTQARFLVNVPVVNGVFAINVTGDESYLGNWYYNLADHQYDAGGHNNQNLRVGALYTPTDKLSWYVTANYSHVDESSTALQSIATDYVVPPYQQETAACLIGRYCGISLTPYDYYSLFNKPSSQDAWRVASNLDYHFSAVTLSSITGYSNSNQLHNLDVARVPALFGIDENDRWNVDQRSEELRLSSQKGGGLTLGDRLDWVIGGYFERDYVREVQPLFVYGGSLPAVLGSEAAASAACGVVLPSECGINVPTEQDQVTRSSAAYLDATFDITHQWNLTFGARQSWDHIAHNAAGGETIGAHNPYPTFGAPFSLDVSFQKLTFEAGTQYKFDDSKMAYFRFAQGYRAGGVQGGATAPTSLYPLIYQPETVNSYEVGAKTDWFDRHLRVNIAVFDNEYSNLQREIVYFTPAATQVVENAASATVRGVEIESMVAPTEKFDAHANLGYINAAYSKFAGNLETGVLTGPYDESLNVHQQFPYTPRFTVNLGFNLRQPVAQFGTTTLSANWNWQSAQNLNDVTLPVAEQGSYGLVNLSLRWDDPTDRYAVSVYGKNVFDVRYKSYVVPALGTIATYGMPATWGLELLAKF